ncbi:hypothetical protein, partial [Gardnerella sp. 30-4]|uniref:hypothetical protein n=1 Tax=Gardnerella sp. 30-4 TaxID=1840518 RepID=UPI001E429EEE
ILIVHIILSPSKRWYIGELEGLLLIYLLTYLLYVLLLFLLKTDNKKSLHLQNARIFYFNRFT